VKRLPLINDRIMRVAGESGHDAQPVFDDDEFLVYYYAADGLERTPEGHTDTTNCVGITDRRVFRVEKGVLKENIVLNNIASVHHEKGGMLRWDQVKFKLADGSADQIGIYKGSIAAFFAAVITTHVQNQ